MPTSSKSASQRDAEAVGARTPAASKQPTKHQNAKGLKGSNARCVDKESENKRGWIVPPICPLRLQEVEERNRIPLEIDFSEEAIPMANYENKMDPRRRDLIAQGFIGIEDDDQMTCYKSMREVFEEGFGPRGDRALRRKQGLGTHPPIDIYDPVRGLYGVVRRQWEAEQPTLWAVTAMQPRFNALDEEESREFLNTVETIVPSSPPSSTFGREKTSRNARPPPTNAGPITLGSTRAIDIGTGIGRLAVSVLAPRFSTIDLVEPIPHLLERAVETVRALGKLGEARQTSVELLELPAEPTYDVINMQWVAMYLTDNDVVDFLKRAKKALRNGTAMRKILHVHHATQPETSSSSHRRDDENKGKKAGGKKSATQQHKFPSSSRTSTNGAESTAVEVPTTGIIFLKENVVYDRQFIVNKQIDPCFTRSLAHYHGLFREAGLRILHSAPQCQWGADSYAMEMFALVPDDC